MPTLWGGVFTTNSNFSISICFDERIALDIPPKLIFRDERACFTVIPATARVTLSPPFATASHGETWIISIFRLSNVMLISIMKSSVMLVSFLSSKKNCPSSFAASVEGMKYIWASIALEDASRTCNPTNSEACNISLDKRMPKVYLHRCVQQTGHIKELQTQHTRIRCHRNLKIQNRYIN